jgi:hypothetical protein
MSNLKYFVTKNYLNQFAKELNIKNSSVDGRDYSKLLIIFYIKDNGVRCI